MQKPKPGSSLDRLYKFNSMMVSVKPIANCQMLNKVNQHTPVQHPLGLVVMNLN